MTEYQPEYRRPIASAFRRTANYAVSFCVARGIHPDSVSYSSVVAAAAAAACFFYSGRTLWLVIPAAMFCYLRLWFNMLDGMVALASGKASRHGEIVNELPDRISDILIFAGVAHSGLNSPTLAYWAALLAVLTAYVGILGQAVGVQREFSGLMTKPWRMVALHIGSWAMLFSGLRPSFIGERTFSIMDWTLVVIIVGCLQTVITRLRRIFRSLAKLPEKARP